MEIYTAALFASFLCMAIAYPYGAPEQACGTFKPSHINRSTGQEYKAQNENEQFEEDDSECPYDVSYSSKFVPGQTITLTITAREPNDYFRGYLLTVVQDDVDSVEAQGVFGSSMNTICSGAAVTQSNGSRVSVAEIPWTAPADSSKKKFEVRMTVVKSFSRFWVSCNPIELPAADADDDLATTSSIFDIPTGSKEDKHDHDHHNDNSTSIFKSEEFKDSQDSAYGEDEVSSSSMIMSEEDLDSEGQDESGNSDENSIDVSDNRSGSSLNSDEKEEKRKQYFAEGIENFDSDIKKLLIAVNKEGAYEQFKSEALRSGADVIRALTVLMTAAVALLTLA